jgi:hypothetical protein
MSSPLIFYVCNECKKMITESNELLFVEEHSSRGFCSEACIEDFYAPISKFVDYKILELRKKLDIEFENIQTLNSHDENYLVEECAKSADEIWAHTNELRDNIYTYIKFKADHYLILICTRYNEEPSFILGLVQTKSKKLLEEFRTGQKIEISDSHSNTEIDEDLKFIEVLENKKSSMIAELLESRKDHDIAFESFSDYESFFSDTLENPDETYEAKDREGDKLISYLKTYLKNNETVYYIIICLKKINEKNNVEVYPVLSFPTIDSDLYLQYRTGECLMSLLKN